MRNFLGLVVPATCAIFLAVVASESRAATATWNASGASAWISTANWNVSGTYPGALGTTANTDVAVIAATAISGHSLGLNLNTPTNKSFSVGGVLWNYTAATGTIGNSSTASSGTLRLNGGSFNVGSTGGTINNLLIAVGDTATSNLNLNNNAAGGSQSTSLLLNNTSGTMYVASGRTLAINTSIIEPSATQTGFTKSGAGVLSLNAANTFSGTVTVSSGTLRLQNSSALGTGSVLLGSAARQLRLSSANMTIDRPVTVTGGAGGGTSGEGVVHYAQSGTATLSGNVTINGSPASGGTFGTDTGELVLSGTVTAGPSTNVQIRTGTVTFSGTNNSFSFLSVSEGTVKAGADSAIPSNARVEVGNNSAFNGTFDANGYNPTFRILTSLSSVSGTVCNNAEASSTLTLTGSTYNSTPNTVISRSGTGTLTVGGGAGVLGVTFSTGGNVPVVANDVGLLISATLTSANGFTKIGNGTLTLSANNASTLGGTVTGSNGTIVARTAGALGSGTVGLAGATLQFETNGGTYATAINTTTATQINANNVAVTLSGPITIAGDVTFRGQGGGSNQFTLSNANAITSTNNSSVTFNVDSSQNHTVSGIISIGTGAISKVSSATLTLSNAANAFSGGLNQNGSGGITISAAGAQGSGTITFGSGGTGAITFSNVDGTVANDIVSAGGSGGITKSGTGSTLTLSGNNTYTGATTISGGYIRVASSNALAQTGTIALTATSPNPAGLQLEPGVVVNRLIRTGGRSFATTTGYILRSLGGITESQGPIEINNTGGDYGFVCDSGTTTLSGTITSIATGTFTRRAIQFAGGGDFAVTGNIVKGGALAVQDMSVSKQGAGTLTLSGNNDFSAGTSVSAGTLRAGHVSAFGSGTVTVTGGTLDLAGLAIANPLAVTGGSVTNASAYAGTQTVSGAISYAGTVGGTLNVAAGGLLKGNNATFSGPVSITGTHSPGASPGLQTFTNGLGYTSAATLIWELSANTASAIDRGILFDAIDMTTAGALSIDSSATIGLVFNAPLADSTPSTVDWDDAFWGSPQQWKVIDVLAPVTWNEVSFANVLAGNDINGASLATKRPGASFSVAAQGGDLYVVYVPEPSLLAAGIVGLGLVLAIRRRR